MINNAYKLGAKELIIKTSQRYEIEKQNAINIWGEEFFKKVEKELIENGYDLVFVGIRKEESLKRKNRIRENSFLGIINECWPVAEWGWKDIWAYIFLNDIPYASVYEKYGDVIGIEKLRLVTFFDSEFDKFGSKNLDGLLMWKERNIEKDSKVIWDEDDGYED